MPKTQSFTRGKKGKPDERTHVGLNGLWAVQPYIGPLV